MLARRALVRVAAAPLPDPPVKESRPVVNEQPSPQMLASRPEVALLESSVSDMAHADSVS